MKTTLVAIWRWVASVCTLGFLALRGYQIKSAVHRFFFDRKYRDTPITVYPTLAELHAWIDQQKWVKDGLTSLWDAVCTPQKVQAVGQGSGPLAKGDKVHEVGDCDEFAIYTTAAIEKALALGQMKEKNIANPRFFSVVWMERNGMPDGHNVCLLERPQPNGPPKYSYMDYYMPSEPPLDTPAQVAVLIASTYAGWAKNNYGGVESGVMCWCAAKTDLTPTMSGMGYGWNRGINQK
jgi:hypothetical protein